MVSPDNKVFIFFLSKGESIKNNQSVRLGQKITRNFIEKLIMNVAAMPEQSSVVRICNAHSIGQCITASREWIMGIRAILVISGFLQEPVDEERRSYGK